MGVSGRRPRRRPLRLALTQTRSGRGEGRGGKRGDRVPRGGGGALDAPAERAEMVPLAVVLLPLSPLLPNRLPRLAGSRPEGQAGRRGPLDGCGEPSGDACDITDTDRGQLASRPVARSPSCYGTLPPPPVQLLMPPGNEARGDGGRSCPTASRRRRRHAATVGTAETAGRRWDPIGDPVFPPPFHPSSMTLSRRPRRLTSHLLRCGTRLLVHHPLNCPQEGGGTGASPKGVPRRHHLWRRA